MSNIQTQSQDKTLAEQMFEAVVLVSIANTGTKPIYPDPKLYTECAIEIANIAKYIAEIRKKGFGKDVIPNTFTK